MVMQEIFLDASRAASTAAETDEQLMAAFKRGAADAFTTLFVRYKQPLFGFFLRRVADPSQAEELTQETFIAVLRATPRYQATALVSHLALCNRLQDSARVSPQGDVSGHVPGRAACRPRTSN